MTVNVELLDRAVEFVRESAKTGGKGVPVEIDGNGVQLLAWAQDTWAETRLPEEVRAKFDGADAAYEADLLPECGSGCCIAGWVAYSTGAKLRWGRGSLIQSSAEVDLPDGKYESISKHAQRKLGLSDQQAYVLFSGTNTLEQIEKYADMIKAGASDHAMRTAHWEFQNDLDAEEAAL